MMIMSSMIMIMTIAAMMKLIMMTTTTVMMQSRVLEYDRLKDGWVDISHRQYRIGNYMTEQD